MRVDYLPKNFELVASADGFKVGARYRDWFMWSQKILENLKGAYKFLEPLETVQSALEERDDQELHNILQKNILCVDKETEGLDFHSREIFYAVICEEDMSYTSIDEEIKRWYWQYVCRYSFVDGELYGSVLW